MINTIRIFPDRCLVPEYDSAGVTNENNAEILKFIPPKDINGISIDKFDMRTVFITPDGSFDNKRLDDNNSICLDNDLTSGTTLTVVVQFLKDDCIKWSSFPLTLLLREQINDSGEHRQTAIEATEVCREQLSNSLTAAMGEGIHSSYYGDILFPNYSQMSYKELSEYGEEIRIMLCNAVTKIESFNAEYIRDMTIGDCLAFISDLSKNYINNFKQAIYGTYVGLLNPTQEELSNDDFINDLINRNVSDLLFTDELWTELCRKLYQTCGQGHESELKRTLNSYIDITAETWEDLLSELRIALSLWRINTLKMLGLDISNLEDYETEINAFLTALRSATEKASGTSLPETATGMEMVEIIDGIENTGNIVDALYSVFGGNDNE